MEFRGLFRTLVIAALLVAGIVLVARMARESRLEKEAGREDAGLVSGGPEQRSGEQAGTGPGSATGPQVRMAASFETISNASLVDHPGNTGDQFRLRFGDREETFQLYWVQSPEVSQQAQHRVEEQSSYFGGIEPEHVTAAGVEARAVVRELLATRPFSVLTRWEAVGETSKYFAYVMVEHQPGEISFLCELLTVKGLAMITGEPGETPMVRPEMDGEAYARRLRAYTQFAQQQRLGAWRFNVAAPAAPAG